MGEDEGGEEGDGADTDRRRDPEHAAVGGVAEDRRAVGEDEDVGEQDRGDESVEDLGFDEKVD